MVLMRAIGGTLGISIGQTIYANELDNRLKRIPDYHGPQGAAARNDVRGLMHIEVRSLSAS